MDYETFIANLVKPLVLKPEEVTVEQFSDDEDLITIQVKVDSADLGRVIGKKGHPPKHHRYRQDHLQMEQQILSRYILDIHNLDIYGSH